MQCSFVILSVLLKETGQLHMAHAQKYSSHTYTYRCVLACVFRCVCLHNVMTPCRMMLANYLGRKGSEVRLKGVVVFSAGWDVFECTASLEKPLDRFLFNSYLTSCLQASVDRSVGSEGDKPVMCVCMCEDIIPKCAPTFSYWVWSLFECYKMCQVRLSWICYVFC